MDFADTFSSLNCYRFGSEDEIVTVPQRYRSGSYFGINYYNREFELMYTRAMWEVRNLFPGSLKTTALGRF